MYEIFEQLLLKFNLSTYKVSKDTGIPQSTLSTWKTKRNIIGSENATILAKYFGVSIDQLMGNEVLEEEDYYLNPETKRIAQEVFEDKNLRLLFDASRNASPEDIRLAAEMLSRMKTKENFTE